MGEEAIAAAEQKRVGIPRAMLEICRLAADLQNGTIPEERRETSQDKLVELAAVARRSGLFRVFRLIDEPLRERVKESLAALKEAEQSSESDESAQEQREMKRERRAEAEEGAETEEERKASPAKRLREFVKIAVAFSKAREDENEQRELGNKALEMVPAVVKTGLFEGFVVANPKLRSMLAPAIRKADRKEKKAA
jgi:hypothetical protein